MKRFIVPLFLLALALPVFGELVEEDVTYYGLLSCVDNSEVVVVGTVSMLTGVYHPGIQSNGSGMICTDVLVRIDDLIKGQANIGNNYIKFIVQGGTAYHPELDEVVILEVIPEATFEVGEKVMLFIKNSSDETFYQNYPHGRHRLYMTTYGKRPVKDNNVKFRYDDGHGAKKVMELSIDLAKNLAKAFMENKTAALQLENDIKTSARNSASNSLPNSTTTRLINSAIQLIPTEESQ